MHLICAAAAAIPSAIASPTRTAATRDRDAPGALQHEQRRPATRRNSSAVRRGLERLTAVPGRSKGPSAGVRRARTGRARPRG